MTSLPKLSSLGGSNDNEASSMFTSYGHVERRFMNDKKDKANNKRVIDFEFKTEAPILCPPKYHHQYYTKQLNKYCADKADADVLSIIIEYLCGELDISSIFFGNAESKQVSSKLLFAMNNFKNSEMFPFKEMVKLSVPHVSKLVDASDRSQLGGWSRCDNRFRVSIYPFFARITEYILVDRDLDDNWRNRGWEDYNSDYAEWHKDEPKEKMFNQKKDKENKLTFDDSMKIIKNLSHDLSDWIAVYYYNLSKWEEDIDKGNYHYQRVNIYHACGELDVSKFEFIKNCNKIYIGLLYAEGTSRYGDIHHIVFYLTSSIDAVWKSGYGLGNWDKFTDKFVNTIKDYNE